MTDEMRVRLLDRIANPTPNYDRLGGPTGLIHLTKEERDALVSIITRSAPTKAQIARALFVRRYDKPALFDRWHSRGGPRGTAEEDTMYDGVFSDAEAVLAIWPKDTDGIGLADSNYIDSAANPPASIIAGVTEEQVERAPTKEALVRAMCHAKPSACRCADLGITMREYPACAIVGRHADDALSLFQQPASSSSLSDASEPRQLERLRAALSQIALLDEAEGHELTREHAMRAVAIATSVLGKHPSEIFAESFRAQPTYEDGLRAAAKVAEDELRKCKEAGNDEYILMGQIGAATRIIAGIESLVLKVKP